MATLTSTGTKVSISIGEPLTQDAAGYAALAWTEIGELTNVPEFGANVQVVTHDPLATGVTEKNKGFINYGSTTLEAAFDADDAGQQLAATGVTGANKNALFATKLEYQDGSIRYWQGKLFSVTENPGSANSMVTSSIQMEINTVIIAVAAA